MSILKQAEEIINQVGKKVELTKEERDELMFLTSNREKLMKMMQQVSTEIEKFDFLLKQLWKNIGEKHDIDTINDRYELLPNSNSIERID